MNNISLKSIKYESIKSIMAVICSTDTISRADIAERTGLSLVTVGKTADALLELEIISQVKTVKAQAGRRAGMLSVNAEKYALILDLSAYDFRLSLLDLRLRQKDKYNYTYRSDMTYEENLRTFLEQSNVHLSRKYNPADCFGIGVSVPGPYHAENDTINSKHIPEAASIRPGSIIRDYFKSDIMLIDSYINAAAKSNISNVDSYEKKNILYWYIGSTVGGAYAVNGELILGRGNHACDFGSLIQYGNLTLEEKIKLCKSQDNIVDALCGSLYNSLMVLNPHTLIIELDTEYPCDSILPAIKETLSKKYRLPNEYMPDILKASLKYRSAHRGLTLGLREMWLNHAVFCE